MRCENVILHTPSSVSSYFFTITRAFLFDPKRQNVKKKGEGLYMYLFELLYQYFEEHYLSSSVGSGYEYLNFSKTSTTLLMIVGGLCLGMMIASVAAFIQKKLVGKLVQSLLKNGATTKEKAMSLKDLGLEKNSLIKHELSYASGLRKLLTIEMDGECFTYLDELKQAFPEFAQAVLRSKKADDGNGEEGSKDEADTSDEKEQIERAPSSSKKKRSFKDAVLDKRFRLKRLDYEKTKFFISDEMKYRAEFRYAEKGNSVLWLVLAFIGLVAVFLLALRYIPVFVNMLDVSIGNVLGK